MDSTDMNILSSLLLFIGTMLKRTRSAYGKGTHTVTRLFGVYGYMGVSNTLTLCIPINLENDVSSIEFTNLVASIRIVGGGYIYSTSTDMHSLISQQTVVGKQPMVIVRLVSTSFTAAQNTPVSGEISAATFTLS